MGLYQRAFIKSPWSMHIKARVIPHPGHGKPVISLKMHMITTIIHLRCQQIFDS